MYFCISKSHRPPAGSWMWIRHDILPKLQSIVQLNAILFILYLSASLGHSRCFCLFDRRSRELIGMSCDTASPSQLKLMGKQSDSINPKLFIFHLPINNFWMLCRTKSESDANRKLIKSQNKEKQSPQTLLINVQSRIIAFISSPFFRSKLRASLRTVSRPMIAFRDWVSFSLCLGKMLFIAVSASAILFSLLQLFFYSFSGAIRKPDLDCHFDIHQFESLESECHNWKCDEKGNDRRAVRSPLAAFEAKHENKLDAQF